MENITQHYNWSKFYWNDWGNDAALQSCDMASQGLWINLLRLMFHSENPGYLQINGKPMTALHIAKCTGFDRRSIEKKLTVLIENNVCSVDENGILFCRRMVREFQTRLKKTNKKETCQQPTGGDLATSKQPTGGDRAARLQKEIAENSQKNKSSLYTESDTESDTDNNPLINPPLNQPTLGFEKTKKQKSDPRGYRLPKDWQPNAEERAYAEAHGLDPDEVAQNFRDYWCDKPGKEARRVGWTGTWRRWVRKAAKQKEEEEEKKKAFRNQTSNHAQLNQKIDQMGKIIQLNKQPKSSQNQPSLNQIDEEEKELNLMLGGQS